MIEKVTPKKYNAHASRGVVLASAAGEVGKC